MSKTVEPESFQSELLQILMEGLRSVLSQPEISADDNFFELGGDFYKAVKVAAYLNDHGFKLDAANLLKSPIVKEAVKYVGLNGENENDSEREGVNEEWLKERLLRFGCKDSAAFFEYIRETIGGEVEIEDIYSLSPVQERMYMYAFFYRNSNANYLQYSFRLCGNVDVGLFEQSFNIVIQRHAILRTVFTSKRVNKPVQVVLKTMYSPIHFEDISDRDEAAQEEYLETVKRRDEQRGFNLHKGHLIRMAIFRTGAENYKVIWSFHHILLDGWGIEIVSNELFNSYRILKEAKAVSLGKVYHYADYIEWLERQNDAETVAYWQKYLERVDRQGILRKFGNQVAEGSYQREEVILPLTLAVSEQLRELARLNCVTLDAVFQGIWGLILQAFLNSEDVFLMTVVSGRPSEIAGIEKMAGFFVNINPVRVKSIKEDTFIRLIKQLHDAFVESKKYEYYPIKQIAEKLNMAMDLTDNVLILESYPLDEEVAQLSQQGNYEFAIVGKEVYQQTGFDFNLVIIPGDKIKIALNYNSLIYHFQFIAELEKALMVLVETIATNSEATVHDLKSQLKPPQDF